MTLTQAIEVLNRVKHGACTTWYAREWVSGEWSAEQNDPYRSLSAFEAIAVAEKYERDGL